MVDMAVAKLSTKNCQNFKRNDRLPFENRCNKKTDFRSGSLMRSFVSSGFSALFFASHKVPVKTCGPCEMFTQIKFEISV